MKEPVVIDSTCLIGLERIGKLDILPEFFEPISIPDEVFSEFGTRFPWLNVETPANFALVNALKLMVMTAKPKRSRWLWRKTAKYFRTTGRHEQLPKGSV